jgi:hypothetical protein
MTQQQQQIIEDYLFDVFVKLEGNGEKSANWWNNVFLLEAITTMGQHNYRINAFCEPGKFFQGDDDEDTEPEETEHDDEEDNTSDNDSYNKFTITRRHEDVNNYLVNYYQHQEYYYYLMIWATGERGGASEQERVLQQQYLYVYTLENSEYFMNKFIYGDDIMLK